MQKTDGSLRMTENYHKLYYMTISIVALGQMWLHCLSKLTHTLVLGVQLLICQLFFLSDIL